MTVGMANPSDQDRVVVVGAGIGGLSAAVRLAHEGFDVTVVERHTTPGGKLRTLGSAAGPVDAGPTVLTLLPIFENLFASIGERIEDHLTLVRQSVLARHFWPDGSQLDLYEDPKANTAAIREFAGNRAAEEFANFDARAESLWAAFEEPVIQSSRPDIRALMRKFLGNPALIPGMAPLHSLDRLLREIFSDLRLAQLFGRYATYVGGSPYQSPALLALIWRAESAGVWTIEGGLHCLAASLEHLARQRGATFRYANGAARIETTDGKVTGLTLDDGEQVPAGIVVFNGDPIALTKGALGAGCTGVAGQTRRIPRALSAEVWAFASRVEGPDLAHHNVFFRERPAPEFAALARGQIPPSPTLYICAMDRGFAHPKPDLERFEIIANAAPSEGKSEIEDFSRCQERTFGTLNRFGLTFDPLPGPASLTRPPDFNRLFPHSAGSLYGQSPHGLMAAFRRPTARTKIKGLYLAGGGVHPGAGLPMATVSARHAVEAILTDRTSTFRSRRTATRGGTSMASAKTESERSASSAS